MTFKNKTVNNYNKESQIENILYKMNIYNGSHGTSVTRYEKIKTDGFHLGLGRCGTGVYFWKKSLNYHELAIGWYKYRKSRNYYRKDANSNGIIIDAIIAASEDQTIDLEDQELKEDIAHLANNVNIDINSIKAITGLYDLFISKIEEKINKKLQILLIRTAPPPEEFCPKYPIKLLGAPYCCIARETKCITIKNVIPIN